jgi:hypothetical protein
MKKFMGHQKGKLSLSILSVAVLLVGVLAGLSGITSLKARGKQPAATSRSSQNGVAAVMPAASKTQVSSTRQAAAPAPAATVAAKPAAQQSAASQESAAASPAPAASPASNDTPAKSAKLPTADEARAAAAKLPLVFEPNRGQTDSQVKFMARSFGYQVFLTGPASATMKFPENRKHERKPEDLMKKERNPDVITMTLAGANNSVAPQLLDPTGGTSDYNIGSDPSKWIKDVPNYTKLRYDGVYPGVGVVYQGDNQRFRYDFEVAPGADPKAIHINYAGSQGIRLDDGGNTVVDLTYGHMVVSKPVIFQEYGGQRHTIDGHYVLSADKTVSFEVGAYDKSQTLIIDPSYSYATYLGPQGTGKGGAPPAAPGEPVSINAVAIDSTGVYFAGSSENFGYPGGCVAGPASASACGGGSAVIVLKLTLNLATQLKSAAFATPGTSYSTAYGAAVNGANLAVVGVTDGGPAWPVKTPLEASPGDANNHAFVMQLSSSALAVNWSTILSGTGTEAALAVAVENTPHAGNIHVTGYTSSGATTQKAASSFMTNLPAAAGSQPFQAAQASSSTSLNYLAGNAFYVDILSAGTGVQYATLFGGWNEDFGDGVAVDAGGNAYIAGISDSFGAGQIIGFENSPGNPATAATQGTTATGAIGAPGLFVLNTPIGSDCFEGGGPIIFPPPSPATGPPGFLGTPVTAQGSSVVNWTGSTYQIVAIALTNPGAGYSVTQNPLAVSTGCGTIYAYISQFVVKGSDESTQANNLPIPTDTLTLTNPGSAYDFTPTVTFDGGQCVVEPTAIAIVDDFTGSLDSLVLTSPGTGCVTPPLVTIQPPGVEGGLTGVQATAVYTPGTTNILINAFPAYNSGSPNADVGGIPNPHAFLAKFNPYVAAATGSATNPNSLIFAEAIGNAGPNFNEVDEATSVAVDLYGDVYLGGATGLFTVLDPPPYVVTNPIFTGSTATGNTIFTSPGQAAGELTSITVTNAGFGFAPSSVVNLFFAWGSDPNDGCLIYPSATAATDAAGEIIPFSIIITNSGLGCTIVPQVGVDGNGLNANGFTALAALGTQIAGVPNAGFTPSTQAPGIWTGWVMEQVAQTSLNSGLTTTSTQDGIPLGPKRSVSDAGWPAFIYATYMAGDEACAPCTPSGSLAGGFGNGSGGGIAGSSSFVTGVTVDGLLNTYVSGYIDDGNIPGATGVSLLARRRVNAYGYPDNPITTYNQANIAAANSSYLADFQNIVIDGTPETAGAITAQDVSPFGSVEIAAGAGFEGVLAGVAFDPITLTACWGGWLDEPLPAGTGSGAASAATPPAATAFQLFADNLTSPLNFAVLSAIFGPADGTTSTANTGPFAVENAPNFGWMGIGICTPFNNDIVVKNTNPLPGETASTFLFTLPTGTEAGTPGNPVSPPSTPNFVPNNPNWPGQQTLAGTIDGTLGSGATVSLAVISQTYYQGKSAESAGDGPDSATASDILWLVAQPQGSSVLLYLNTSISSSAPGAAFLDPGIYYCLVTIAATASGDNADNSGIPQTIIVQLNVTGTLYVNSVVGGGIPATGSNAAGNVITLNLQAGSGGSQQSGLGSAQWTTAGQTLDLAGNLVLNIPVVSNVPLQSPSHGNFVFLLNQGTIGLPKPLNNQLANAGTTNALNANLAILNTGFNTGNEVTINSVPTINPLTNDVTGAGSVFLTPLNAEIEVPGGTLSPVADIQFLPGGETGAAGCSPFNPPDQDDPNSKAGANNKVCYIQVIIPPTILQGATLAGGPYTVNLELQSVPNLTDPANPVRNDHSKPYLDFVPIASSDGDLDGSNQGVETFCVGSTGCTLSALGAVSGSSPVAKVTLSINLAAGPLIINSPWISNTITSCNDDTSFEPGAGFSDPVCNTNGARIPLAPFTVPTSFGGIVTSNINSVNDGNNPANTYNNVVLDSRNLGTTTEGGYTVTVTGGLQNVGIGQSPSAGTQTTVSALQVQNDYMVYQDLSDLYPIYQVPTCTLASPAIPASMLSVNGVTMLSGAATTFNNVLPASNASQTTTAFTIGIVDPAALANGFYASTLEVTPIINGSPAPAQATQIPVCLEVGNNIDPVFEKITQSEATTPSEPAFDPSSFIIPPDGLILAGGLSQYVQLIINALGPNQMAPILGQATFGTPMFVAIPVTITPVASPLLAPITAYPNSGNEFSAPYVTLLSGVYLGSINEGGVSNAVNCSQITGWANPPDSPVTGCLTNAYMNFVVFSPTLTGGGQQSISFTVVPTGNGLLSSGSNTIPSPQAGGGSTPSITVTLPVFPTTGAELVYTACAGVSSTVAPPASGVCAAPTSPGVVAYLTLIASLGYTGGYGYSTVPNVHFSGGCTVEPTAVATLSQPGPIGYVSGLFITNPGSGCNAAPIIVIDPPNTSTGVQAEAQAFISSGVMGFTFDLFTATQPGSANSCLGSGLPPSTSCNGPAYDTIYVQSSQFPASVLLPTSSLPLPTIYYNPPATYLLPVGPPVAGDWLSVVSVNCQPMIPNPTPIAECEFTISLNTEADTLPAGTYEAFVAFQAGGVANLEPGVEELEVTLNVTGLPSVVSTLPASGASFQYIVGAANTVPTSVSTSLSVNALPSGVTGIPVTVTPTESTGPANWVFISLNGGTAGPGSQTGTLTTSGIPLVISVNPAVLSSLVAGNTYNGTITVSTSPSSTSTPTVTIPVTLQVSGQPSLQFSDTVDGAAVTCSPITATGGISCTGTSTYTVGQAASAPPGFAPVLTLLGSTPDTLNLTVSSNATSWLSVTPTSTTSAATPLTVTISPTALTTPGTLTGVITAKGLNGPETATFTVVLTVQPTPSIVMTPIAAQTVSFGASPFTVTTQVSLSAPGASSPVALGVSCPVTGGGSWLSENTGNPTTLTTTPQTFTYTITPATTPQPVGTFAGGKITCTITSGLPDLPTPPAPVTASTSVSLTVNGTLTTNPPNGSTNPLIAGGASYVIGQPVPTANLSISSGPTGETATLVSSATWLTVSQPTAVTPATVQVSINPSDPAIVANASLTGTITVSIPNSTLDCASPVGTGATAVCESVITYTLGVKPEPLLGASPTSLLYNVPTGFTTPQTMPISITDNPVQAIPVTTAISINSGGNWLAATGGTTPFTSTVTVSDPTTQLAPGMYAGSVAYSSTEAASPGTQNVPVNLNVGTLTVTGGPVTFNHQFGVTTPASSTLSIGSLPATYTWVATVTPIAPTTSCAWLLPGPATGMTNSTVSVSYNPAVLPDANATYACTITYTPAASYGSPESVPVVVTLNTIVNPVFVVTPTSQTIPVLLGSVPGTATTSFEVSVNNILAPNTSISATITPSPSNPLLTGLTPTPVFTAPATMTVTTTPQPLVITANYAGLPVGTYQGSFTISSTAVTTPVTVVVNLVVSATCTFAVSPIGPINLTNVVPANGTTPVSVPGAFSMTPGAGCSASNTWAVTSNASWLIVTSGATGNGGSVGSGTYLALSNSTPIARTALLTFNPSAGTPQVITVTQTASTAPILDLEVTALYQQILGRDPDSGGYPFWTGQGAAGLGQMADDFFTSPESMNTNFAVIAAYQAATGAPPTFAVFTTMTQDLAARYGTLTPASIFNTLTAGVSNYTAASLYQNLLGRATTAGDATCINSGLTNCFLTLIGYPASATPVGPGTNMEFWSTGTFANHTASCTAGTCTVPGDHTNNLYIYMLYFTTLGRDPDSGGLEFWFGQANAGGAGILFQGSTEQAARINILGTGAVGEGFIGSPEFQGHF